MQLASIAALLFAAADLREADRDCLRMEFARAAAAAEAVLHAEPGNADAWVILGRARIGQGNPVQALDALERALKLNPAHEDGLYFASKLAAVLATQNLHSLMAASPPTARSLELAGETMFELGRHSEAQAAFAKSLQLNPRNAAAMSALGDLQREAKQYDEAIRFYQRARSVDPRGRAFDAAYGLGVSYLRQGRITMAEAEFRKALAARPQSGLTRIGLGEALFQAGRIADAVKELEIGLKTEPGVRQAWYYLGRGLQKLNQGDRAREAFQKVNEIIAAEQWPSILVER